jgi:hypothetical protein
VTRFGDERGFTLTEVAVASVLVILVLLPLLRFFDGAVSGASELQRSTQLHADGRFVVDRLTRELRQAYTGDDALPPVAVDADGLAMTVYSPDTSSPFRLRRIAYRIQGDQLERSTTSSLQTSCPETTSVCTGYGPAWTFPAAGSWVPVLAVRPGAAFTPVTTDGEVRAVTIELTGTNAKARADRLFRTTVDLRNA